MPSSRFETRQYRYVNVCYCDALICASTSAAFYGNTKWRTNQLVHVASFCFTGFTLDGTVKILDFGLAKIVENASVECDDAYTMSGETGSLRYMAPEVADALPYNAGADVYSFGIILWEINASKKPYEGLNRELFYERVVHGGERPPLNKKWPQDLTSLMKECWDADMRNRPSFRSVVERLDAMLEKEKGGAKPPSAAKNKKPFFKVSGMIDRHSTWF
jgi:serine/threonine protein kinase